MKRYIIILLTLLLSSCGSYNSINSFYNAHKNDANVTAIQVPNYLLSLLRNPSGEMNNFMGNVKDIRYIQLSPKTDNDSRLISNQINNLTTNNFVEVFRERKDVVKEGKFENLSNSVFKVMDFSPSNSDKKPSNDSNKETSTN